jgi:hypothetical protein
VKYDIEYSLVPNWSTEFHKVKSDGPFLFHRLNAPTASHFLQWKAPNKCRESRSTHTSSLNFAESSCFSECVIIRDYNVYGLRKTEQHIVEVSSALVDSSRALTN